MQNFKAHLDIIGINPFVYIPDEILHSIFIQAGKEKSPIPVRGKINGIAFKQNLMKYKGEWRLYINNIMLKDSPKRIGELIDVKISFDPEERKIKMHPKLKEALNKNTLANKKIQSLSPSRRKEIMRYINSLKTEVSIMNNVDRAIKHLLGESKFVGRDKP